jgi:YbbR domain-containing protein
MAKMNFKDTIAENFELKVMSLFLAVVVWFSVTFRLEGVEIITVPITLGNIPAQLAVAGTPPSVLDLEISGPKFALMMVRNNRLTAMLDLKGAGEGTVSFTNLERTVQLRNGLRVLRVQPSTIEIHLVKPEKPLLAHPEQ